MHVMDWLLVIRVSYKKSYLNNYSEQIFCQANCFNFQSNQDSFSVRLLASHIKFEKRKELKKKISEELMPIVWHPKSWWNFFMSED